MITKSEQATILNYFFNSKIRILLTVGEADRSIFLIAVVQLLPWW